MAPVRLQLNDILLLMRLSKSSPTGADQSHLRPEIALAVNRIGWCPDSAAEHLTSSQPHPRPMQDHLNTQTAPLKTSDEIVIRSPRVLRISRGHLIAWSERDMSFFLLSRDHLQILSQLHSVPRRSTDLLGSASSSEDLEWLVHHGMVDVLTGDGGEPLRRFLLTSDEAPEPESPPPSDPAEDLRAEHADASTCESQSSPVHADPEGEQAPVSLGHDLPRTTDRSPSLIHRLTPRRLARSARRRWRVAHGRVAGFGKGGAGDSNGHR